MQIWSNLITTVTAQYAREGRYCRRGIQAFPGVASNGGREREDEKNREGEQRKSWNRRLRRTSFGPTVSHAELVKARSRLSRECDGDAVWKVLHSRDEGN